MTMETVYRTQGVCSRAIKLKLDQRGVVEEVAIDGGCHGNSQGIQALVKGQDAREVAARLRGIRCGGKNTSCPDQLSRALLQALDEMDVETEDAGVD